MTRWRQTVAVMFKSMMSHQKNAGPAFPWPLCRAQEKQRALWKQNTENTLTSSPSTPILPLLYGPLSSSRADTGKLQHRNQHKAHADFSVDMV